MRYYIDIFMIIFVAQLAKIMSPKLAYRVANTVLVTAVIIMLSIGFHLS